MDISLDLCDMALLSQVSVFCHPRLGIDASLGYVQTIEGEGMPLFDNHNLHGDLYVEYNVVLPVEISSHTRRSKFKTITAHLSLLSAH